MPVEMPKSLAAALAAFQARLPEIRKSETAEVRGENKAGRQFNYTYKYADLAAVSQAVLPLLGELGLSWVTTPTLTDGRFVLAYRLGHVFGDSITGEYPLPGSGTPQEIGSAITYARRYCLCSVTGVAPDQDDDGAAASRGREDEWEAARPASPKQTEVFEVLSRSIAEADSPPAIHAIGSNAKQAEQEQTITHYQYERLARQAAARLAELERAAKPAEPEGGEKS